MNAIPTANIYCIYPYSNLDRNVLDLSLRPFVCIFRLLPTSESHISKRNEPISMQICTNLPTRQGHDRSTLGVRRSKVKVTGGRSNIWKPAEDIILDPLSRVDRVSDRNVAIEQEVRCCT